MSRFAQIFLKLLEEDNFAGAGGALGNAPSMQQVPGVNPTYADSDMRAPFTIGTFKRSGKVSKRNKRRKKK